MWNRLRAERIVPLSGSMARTRSLLLFILALLAADALVVLVLRARRKPPPSVDMDALRSGFTARVDGAARGGFLTTGNLYVTATAVLRREELQMRPLRHRAPADDTALVRVTGRVGYGFDIMRLTRDSIEQRADGAIVVGMPPLETATTTADLDRLELRTRRGWLRTPQSPSALSESTRATLDRALRAAARRVLATSKQPRAYTAHLLEGMLSPAARAAGEPRPRMFFRFPTTPAPPQAALP